VTLFVQNCLQRHNRGSKGGVNIIILQVEGFYANKKKSRTKKYLLEWSWKAVEKATG